MRGFDGLVENDEHFDMLALHRVRLANGCCFCNCRVTDQAGLDFHGAETVTADFDNVVHTTLNSYVAIAVHMSGIAGKIHTLDGIPVGYVTRRISENRAHLRRPGMAHDQKAPFARRNRLAVFVDYIGLDGW